MTFQMKIAEDLMDSPEYSVRQRIAVYKTALAELRSDGREWLVSLGGLYLRFSASPEGAESDFCHEFVSVQNANRFLLHDANYFAGSIRDKKGNNGSVVGVRASLQAKLEHQQQLLIQIKKLKETEQKTWDEF